MELTLLGLEWHSMVLNMPTHTVGNSSPAVSTWYEVDYNHA